MRKHRGYNTREENVPAAVCACRTVAYHHHHHQNNSAVCRRANSRRGASVAVPRPRRRIELRRAAEKTAKEHGGRTRGDKCARASVPPTREHLQRIVAAESESRHT